MEDVEPRKARSLEHVVARWLRRSRESVARGRASVGDVSSEGLGQPGPRVTLTLTIPKDLLLGHYGFEISPQLPLTVASVAAGGAADGKLLPGDQILSINHEAVEHVSVARAASLLRDPEDSLLLTVLRCASGGPKSSFLTAEKRARLKSNPVKVRFAEEVLVNGHSQENSLLCLPNVLKVYLENGQTKAFRFDATTTVKDILLTLKEKLSIHCIEHFALALEEQYNLAKLYLLHEEELIEQVVQRKDAPDYRCLFRVCFVPKDPLDLLQDDPVTFEYLYLQSCSDVLQERFAMEMKCSVALRLAALHIQERMYTCAQPQKVSFKYIATDWGIENFISPTLLRNMKGKDIKKAISFHMKRNQILLEPRQKHVLSATAVRLSYLQILGDLKMYSGKIFNATLMLQDRESYVALLVGAKYGISQIINNKLNIVTPLAAFAHISRLELSTESEKVSTVKIYLQDVKLLTLMLESHSAKDLACLIAGYYRLYVDAGVSLFPWGDPARAQRVSAEEGYESRACSDSEDSWELEPLAWLQEPCEEPAGERSDSASEASDPASAESREHGTSGSSDSMEALEEDDLEACSASRPHFLRLLAPPVRELGSQVPGSGGPEPTDVLCSRQAGPEPGGEHAAHAAALRTKLSEDQLLEYYSLCSCISPANNRASSIPGHSPAPGSGKELPAELGRGGDTSSEEEFYDAADRLSPTDAHAGWWPLAQAGPGEACALGRVQCCPASQAARAEQVLKRSRSLRKRRSFLQTDYTSQVTFPLAPEGCAQGGLLPPVLSPALASRLSSRGAALLAQLGHQGQARSSAPMDVGLGPGALAPSSSAPALAGPQRAVGGVPLLESRLSAPGSVHGQGSSGASPDPGGWQCPLAEAKERGRSCLVPPAQLIAQQATEDLAAPQESQMPAQGGQATSAGAEPPSPEGCPWATPPGPGPLPAAATGGTWEELACAMGPTGPTSCNAAPGAPEVLGEGAGQPLREEPLGTGGERAPLGCPGAIEMLSGCPGTAGIATHLSWHPTTPGLSEGTDPSPWPSAPATPQVYAPPAPCAEERDPTAGAPGVGSCPGQPQPQPALCVLQKQTAERGQALPLPAPHPTGAASASSQGCHGADPSPCGAGLVPASCHPAGPAGTPCAAGALSPRAGMDNCSCQLVYASCFPGLTWAPEPENGKWADGDHSCPLTRPPAPGCQLSPAASPTAEHSGLQPVPSEGTGPSHPGCVPALAELQPTVCHSLGARVQHLPAACAAHCSAHKRVLCAEAHALNLRCQRVLQLAGPAELGGTLHQTWRALLRLATQCSQFSACGRCASLHHDLAQDLQHVLDAYRQLAHAALQACEQDVGTTQLADQGTALRTALSGLTQRFWAAP